jgi:hypothetical protein
VSLLYFSCAFSELDTASIIKDVNITKWGGKQLTAQQADYTAKNTSVKQKDIRVEKKKAWYASRLYKVFNSWQLKQADGTFLVLVWLYLPNMVKNSLF